MDMTQQSLDLGELLSRWLEDLRRAGEVVDDGDRQDLDTHLLFDLAACPLVLVGLLEFGHCVVVLICELPPLGAELAHIGEGVLLEAFLEC